MRKIYFLALLFIVSDAVFAQSGKITGKVINANSGLALPGATVILIENSKTTIADQNGNFTFSKLQPGIYSIKCSYTGYKEKPIDSIAVKNEDNTAVTVSLEESDALGGVKVVGNRVRAVGETHASLLIVQKNSANVMDGVTNESIKRVSAKTASDVIKMVSGASIQDDRFAIIRGLNDRYNAAFINGAPLPSTESDRKAFAFDIFPSSILDNLIIYKTATPDKSGEFAGGIIDITTKSIMPKNFTSISFGGSYNSLSTGKGRYYPEMKGKKDWLGIDDGTRAIPSGTPPRSDFNSITPTQKSELAKLFGNYKWGIKKGNTGPNYNFQVAKGFNIERKEKEFLGVLMSLSYNRNYTFTDGQRDTYEIDLSAPANAELKQDANYKDSSYNDEVVLAALGNISVKLDNRNSISWKNNLSINTDNRIIKRTGNPDFTGNPSLFVSEAVRWFTSNKIISSQLNGEHQVGPLKTKINWLGAFSKVKREIPNLARTSYSGGGAAFPPVPSQTTGMGSMFFSNSDENIKSFKADISQPYTFMKNTQQLLKIGGGYQVRKRDFTSRTLGFIPNNFTGNFDFSLIQLPEDQIFLPQHLGKLKNGKDGFLLSDGTLNNSDYDASSALTHVYIMNDQRFFEKFRLIYGVRMESYNQKLNAIRDNNDTIRLNTTVTDFLPSVNFVYAVTTKMNLRLSYSQTINRPEFRELAPFLFFDYATAVTYQGDPGLKRAKIDNYDFRYEFFPGRAQVFSASAFYKDFTNPIEILQIPNTSSQTKYVNTQSAKVYGVEVEFRTLVSTLFGIKRENAFLSKFTLAGNAAYIKSDVVIGPNVIPGIPSQVFVTNRALQGQSPYIINGSLGFNDEKTGLSSTLSVNRVGDRVILSGTKLNPNIYEKARTVADFQVAKFFVKNILELKFTVRDILAKDIGFYFDIDESKSFTERDRYFGLNRAPRVFNFSATYKF